MNIVVDTSVLISALFWKGPPAEALKIILADHFLVQSQPTLKEFTSVVRRDKFKSILQNRGLTPEILIETLLLESKFFSISRSSEKKSQRIEIADEKDRPFLELAFESKAPFIISGDKHLLNLKKAGEIELVGVQEFLGKIKK